MENTCIIHSLRLQFNRWVLRWNDFNCSYPQHAVILPEGYVFCCLYSVGQRMVKYWWFGFLGSPYERDCFLGVALESQTTNLPFVDLGTNTKPLHSWDIWISRVPCNLHRAPTRHILQDPWDWASLTSFTKSNSTIRVQYLEVQDT